jgi:YegS/Rv2252/BmrU family lipid kinase
MKIGIVLNPVAGAGRAAQLWPQFENEIRQKLGDFALMKTERPEDAARLARQLAEQGSDLVIAAGGDGTIGETVDGLLTSGLAPSALPRLAILPCGTGSDFARSLGVTGTPQEMIARIAAGKEREIDAGRVTFVDDEGRAAMRHFINVASLGLSGPTSRAVNKAKRSGKASGQLLFMWHTVRELIRYKFQDVRISVDGAPAIEARIAVAAAANGRFFGGGMMIAPQAELDNGMLDLVIFRGAAKLTLIKDMRLLYTGSHTSHPAVTILRGRKIIIEPAGDPALNAAQLDIDGESPGSIPAAFEVLPKAIRVIC